MAEADDSGSPPLLARDGQGGATITLNRPRHLNRLHREDLLVLQDHIATLAADDSLRVVVLTGTGRAFCAGFNLQELAEAAEARLSGTGLETSGIDDTICCYATKVETWVTDPDGAKWEWYVKTGDADQLTNQVLGEGETANCCAPGAACGS